MRLIFIISAATVCLSIIELISHEQLESTGAYIIEEIQKDRSEGTDELFLMIGSVTSICFFLISGICYLTGYKEIGLLGIFGSQLGAAFSGVLKSAFAHPRPFWKYSEIDALQCSKDFGAPSGHAMSAGGSLFVLGYIWMKNTDRWYIKLFIIIMISIITAYDRLYLGVHFYFQIILGYAFALLISAIIVHPSSINLLQKFGNDKELLIKSQITWLLLLVFSTIFCLCRSPDWDESWSINYEKACGNSFAIEDVIIKNTADSYVFSLLGGLTMGHYLQKEKGVPEFSLLAIIISGFLHLGFINICLKMIEGYISLSTSNFLGWILLFITRYSCGIIYAYFLPEIIFKLFRKNEALEQRFSVLTFKIKV
ncbi:unnamed protein product [Blepharisma stoltei]|uniref:Phosphatidic acid phosphatase type 2/haloperoxidase domain-containing protein n=1 Tax=Blepharisma stoltei TaxID=1481888 RepID=A0AAU9K977_9CILI|nr:unnamed protein product [Blepharisma stoltei]